MDGKQQIVKVWSLSLTVGVHCYVHQCYISLLVEFDRLTCRTKEFLLLSRILQCRACLWNVHCADYKNRNQKGDAIDFLAKKINTTEVWRKVATG